jgi:hypothetical protein
MKRHTLTVFTLLLGLCVQEASAQTFIQKRSAIIRDHVFVDKHLYWKRCVSAAYFDTLEDSSGNFVDSDEAMEKCSEPWTAMMARARDLGADFPMLRAIGTSMRLQVSRQFPKLAGVDELILGDDR